MVKFSNCWDSYYLFLAIIAIAAMLIGTWSSSYLLIGYDGTIVFYPFRVGWELLAATSLTVLTICILRTIFDRHSRRLFKSYTLRKTQSNKRQIPVYRTMAIPPHRMIHL